MVDCVLFVLWSSNLQAALMEDRPDLKPGSDHYLVYPGGKREPGESVEQTMLREAMEETGIVPTEYFLLADDLYARPSEGSKLWVKAPDGWRVYAYLVTRWQGSIPTHTLDDHHSPLSWIDPKKVVRDEGSTEFSRNVEVAQRIIMWEVVA